MAQAMRLFTFQDHAIHVIMRDGEPWWTARDVCEALEIANYRDAVNRLSNSMKGVATTDTPGGRQQVLVVNEAGVYKLAFTSRKPEAERFTDWLASEVVPSIRKHGMYATDALLDDPDHLLRVTTRLVEERRARLAAEAQVALMAPKAEFHDKVATAVDCQSIGSVAKVLGTGQNRLFAWLRGQRILLENNQPFQDFIDAGYFKVIEQTWEDKEGKPHLTTKTLVTGRGLAWLQKRFHGKDNMRTMAT